MSVGKRLRQALESKGMSVRAFYREMSGKGVHGSSYPTIHRYLKDVTTPSVEFLREAAALLDVREPWLISGAGASTEEDEKIRLAKERMRQDSEGAEDGSEEDAFVWVYGRFKEKFPSLREMDPAADMAFLGACGAMHFNTTFDTLDEATEALAEHLLKPFGWWGHTGNPDLSTGEAGLYLQTALVAIQLAHFVPQKD
jgi:transcriptional regulator with XRE-family HTH domain